MRIITQTNIRNRENVSVEQDVTLASIYLLKVNNRNTGTRYGICSKLTIKIPEQQHWGRSGVFIVNVNIFDTLMQRFYC